MADTHIDKIVKSIIHVYDTNDPFDICDNLNINVKLDYLGTSNGYYIGSNGVCSIYVNREIEYSTRRAVCAHELGHALLHTNTNIRFMTECTFFSENKFERQANYFASRLLLNDLYDRMPSYEGYSYSEIAIAEAVPVEYVILMLKH